MIGKCAGTIHNPPGDKRHSEQIQPPDPSKSVDQGYKRGGRREYTREMVKNMVQPELVQDLYSQTINGRI